MTSTPNVLPVAMPAEGVSGPPQGQWDYAAYTQLPQDGNRYELIGGVLYMAPAPGTSHQEANARFITHLMTYVRFAGLGRVLGPPYDVELAPNVVVQPDVVVVLNVHAAIITPTHIVGAPDLVVEIASPSTAGYDRREKQDTYAQGGVTEYWIADPAARTIEVLVLEQERYRSLGIFRDDALLPSAVVPGLPVPAGEFFG
jgi:Uma2 family endonuclease